MFSCRTFVFITLNILIYTLANAQPLFVKSFSKNCNIVGDSSIVSYACQNAPSDFLTYFNRIVEDRTPKTKIAAVFYSLDVSYACVGYDGKSTFIILNPEMYASEINKWLLYATLCHELGHILNGDITSSASLTSSDELKADSIAGLLLYDLRIPSMEIVYEYYRHIPVDEIHPSYSQRRKFLLKGYKKGSEIENAQYVLNVHKVSVFDILPGKNGRSSSDEMYQRLSESKNDSSSLLPDNIDIFRKEIYIKTTTSIFYEKYIKKNSVLVSMETWDEKINHLIKKKIKHVYFSFEPNFTNLLNPKDKFTCFVEIENSCKIYMKIVLVDDNHLLFNKKLEFSQN